MFSLSALGVRWDRDDNPGSSELDTADSGAAASHLVSVFHEPLERRLTLTYDDGRTAELDE